MAQQFDIVGNLLLKVDGAEAGLNKLKSSLSQLKMPANLDSSLKKSFSNLDGLFAKYKAQLQSGFNTKGDITSFAKTGRQIEAEYDRISAAISKVTGKEVNLKVDLTAIHNAEKEVEKLITLKEKLSQDIKGGLGLNDYLKAMQASDVGRKGTKVFDASNILQTSLGRGDITKAKADVENLISELNRMSDARKKALEDRAGVALTQIISDLRTKVNDADQAMNKFGNDIKATSDNMAQIRASHIDNVNKALSDATGAADGLTSEFKELNGTAQQSAESMFSMTKQLGDLQQSTQYFFSLRNMINLFRRGVDDAIQSVKELDKAMTDTAVVTDYKVSDMWNMLPQYTQIANELGATTQGAYETMTLYFQQGLNQQQAFELGAETMKMARIAGLDYAETTDMMTAALRGFNMELDETSARRINDVYSKLAAVTASDTEELGTAMQRTASIAHSAGMSFEGTTAFLAQAIETTREPAENIGTAMKTIIARFQEMKKNPLEISEVDGEEVNFNKVDEALKTIGVDLKDTNGQFRDLDKVFLDISERWNGLSQTQQRYIATTAAGSRQQSRFIAMMDNYDRTMELVSAANNSAGASNEQFNKTMDSLEAKLNRLHNAWQAFTMGIANNGMIKLAVDGITNLLTVTNKLIDTLSLGSGALKSFLSIFMAFNGLKATGKIANALIGGLGGMVDPQSSFAAGFRGGAISKNSAQAINQPIVQELQSIRSLIAQKINQTDLGKRTGAGPYNEYNRFKQARTNIAGLTNKNTVKNLTGQLFGISGKNQNMLMRGNAATFQAATNSLINSYDLKHIKAIKSGERFLNDQRKSAQITAEEYYTALQDPGLLKQAMVKAGVQQDNPVYTYMNGLDEAANIRAKELQDQAIRQAKYTATETGRGTKEVFDKITQGLTTDRANSYFKQKALAEQGVDFSKAGLNVTKMGKILDGIGSIGTGISQAGMGIQAFGNILMSSANPALQAFGSALTSIGGLISGLGMGVSGISSAFTAISGSKLITSIAGTGKIFGGLMTAAGALTGGLLLLGGVIAALVIGIKKHNEKIKKTAEEVSTKYQEKNEKAQTNISNLQSWREDFARLSSGVDANGYNVNLSTEDYDRYLEITRGIAEINPSIVEGYNAQGQAIITNNKALEETLELEKQRQQEAFKEYTSPESLKKLIAARDLSKQTKTTEQTISQYGAETTAQVGTGEFEFKPQAKMRKEAQKIGELLQQGVADGWADSQALKDEFNLDITDLAAGNEEALAIFDQFGSKIQQRINDSMDLAGDELKESTKNDMLEALSGYGEAVEQLDELITPTYNHLLASSSKYASSIPAEFKKYFNEGLKEIASDANITDVDKAARDLANGFEVLSEKGSDYYKILKEVDEAQNTYAQTLKKDDYDAFAAGAVERLNTIRDSLGKNIDLTKGYGKAIDEFIQNEIEKIQKFTEGGAVNLQHALNTMVDQIAAAEGALENFNKIAEGSTYGKAASNMSQIYDTATADEHIAGEGDQAFWAGAEAIVGRKSLLEGGKATKDKALKQMKEVQEMLKGGQEGWDNFKIKWFDTADFNSEVVNGVRRLKDEKGKIIEGLTLDDNGWIKEIDENMNPQVYEQIADALDMSKDSLIAMLNVGRQFGEISFTNIDDVNKALATSDSTIKNNGTIFTRKSSLEADMTQAGVDLNEQQKIEKQLTDRNVQFIEEDLKKITKDNNQFSQMGIDSMESLVKTFDETGQFTKDEIAGYAERWAQINGKEEGWLEDFNRVWEENQTDQEFGGIPNSLTTIESILTSIESLLAQRALAEGKLPTSTADEAKKWLFGGEHADTAAQKFSLGQGENGEAITTSEFNKTSEDLSNFINKGTDYLSQLEQAKQKAIDNEDYAELKKIESERLAYENMVNHAKTYLQEGTQAYYQQQATSLAESNASNQEIKNSIIEAANKMAESGMKSEEIAAAINKSYGTNLEGKDVNIGNNGQVDITLDETKLQEQLSHLHADVEANIVGIHMGGGHATKASGQNNTSSAIRRVGTMASGSKKGYIINGEPTLTGELGPELVWEPKQNKAYMVGEHGPQFANISKNAVVWNAKQTKKIQKNSKGVGRLGTGAYGIHSFGTMANADGAGGAGGSSKISGLLSIDAIANIQDVTSPTKEIIIPAKADLTNESDINNIKATAEVTKVIKGDQVSGEPIKVQATATASVDTGAVDKKTQSISNSLNNLSGKSTNINITSNADQIKQKLTSLEAKANKLNTTKTLTVNVKKTGVSSISVDGHTWSISAKAKGQNNHGFYAPPSIGSAAKGNYGQLGPKGKGGLTLTGELGYEVAWIPSENRSMILGANGPQMINLPNDAVIWNHEQSKQILKQKAIPAGSHYVTSPGATRPGSGGGGGGNSNTAKTVNKTANHVKKKATETANVVQKVSVWWENIARKTEVAQRQQDKNQKAFEKYIKEMRATLQFTGESLESGGGGGDDYLKSIGTTLGYYEAQLEKVTSELSELNEGTEAQIKASEKVQAAKDTKTKKDDKKYKKELAKANKKAYEDNASSAAKVSYKKGKKTKEEIVNLAPYIKEEDGTFIIDQEKLDTIDNKDKRKAVADAANKEINDKLSKKYKAEDEIQKAQDAIEKFGEELYETFFKWENELTKIWNITQKIEQSEAKISRAKSYQDLLDSQIATGSKKIIDNKKNDTGLRAEMLGVFNAGLTQLTQEIHSQVGLLGEQKNHLQSLLNITDERNTLNNVQKKLVGNVRNKNLNDTEVAGYEKYAAELEKAIDAQTQAWKYLSVNQFSDGTIQVDFDTKTFETDKENGEITGDLGKAIQDYVKELTDANKELNSQYETIITKTTEMNDQLKTLQEQWVGYADELWQISNEEQKKQVDNLKKVSDSITNTLKNLLDDVKRKLDQRRKEEDNAKTEKGISQKQQRLAALQADTSGGHQVEIAQLQQEIADEQQNYQRSLEDQLLDNLQQQADVAAQQREQQIALQEATITAVNNAALVNQWMDDPLKYRDTIFEAYKTANDFDEKPKALQDDLIKKFESMFAGLATNKDEQQATQDALKDLNTEREGVVNVLETIKQSVDAITIPSSIEVQSTGANADIKPGNTQAKVEQEQKAVQEEENKRKAEEDKKQAEEEQQQAIAAAQKKYNDFLYNRGDSKSKDKNKGKIGKDGYLQQVARGATLGKSEYQVAKELADTKELTWKEILTAAKKAGKKAKTVKNWNPKADKKSKFRQAFEKVYGKWSKYASGGMADFTGPAWLDGTPSKPELVLNSTDTKNFVALKDVLAKVMNGVGTESSAIGDITYEININVDKIEKDYDVDKVIDKVKKEITKSAGYRNVTQIRNLR